MANLYLWLKFLHIAGLGVFLLAHGVAAGSSLMLRRASTNAMRAALLRASIQSAVAFYPALLVIVVTGVWMGFEGHWWRSGWIWAGIITLVAVIVIMSAVSVPYHKARDAANAKPPADLEPVLKAARPVEVAGVGAIGLFILFFLMVFKPF
ncbi:MAG: DUF2269 family protein [Candidatus Dormiibacterota bacterium]